MIKRIDVKLLRPGMYVHDLDARWIDHNFFRSHFPIKSEADVNRVINQGIKYLYIDTTMGDDLDSALSLGDIDTRLNATLQELARGEPTPRCRSVKEEKATARNIFLEADTQIKKVMDDVREGAKVNADDLDPIVNRIFQSVTRCPYALTGIARIKVLDRYTSMHCVSVAALMTAFARSLGMDEELTGEITKGALLHDIGKALIPAKILNKISKPSEDERRLLRGHVQLSISILKQTIGVTPIMDELVSQHHERIDGSGYPLGLEQEQMGRVGQMAAIADAYDTLTSPREYRRAWQPTYTLKKLLEWSQHHFNPELVSRFIKMQGIFPIGTLVELKSGLVGVVIDQGERLNQPLVKIFYNGKKGRYEHIHEVQIGKTDDTIEHAINPDKYNIDTKVFADF
ncbi:MAG: HD-GYP domain-containing protein [Gammaproteobacteria bacterium]|nr:HD-GYP domain-containing protein [Gammaproteobacteria bacterium]